MVLLPSAFSFDIFHQRCGIWSVVRSHVQYTQNLNTALKIRFCYAQVLWRVGCSCSAVTRCSWWNIIIQLSAVHVSSWSRMFREIDLLSSEVKITLMGCINVLLLITRPSASEDGIRLRYCQAVWGGGGGAAVHGYQPWFKKKKITVFNTSGLSICFSYVSVFPINILS